MDCRCVKKGEFKRIVKILNRTMNSNTEVEDYLTEDPEINGQKIVLLSFLSPEKILDDKKLFMFQKFLKDYDMQWKTSKFEGWLAEQVNSLNSKLETLAGRMESQPGVDVSGQTLAKDIRSNLFRVDHLVEEFQQYSRKNLSELTQSKLQEEFDNFEFKNGAKLEEEFFKLNEFRTTIRGIKVRGVFSSEGEASARAKRLQKADPNFNIYLGAVGKWMAWEPNPNSVVESEYANEQLNTLMKKYRENEENRDTFYTEQKNSRVNGAKTSGKSVTPIDSVESAGPGASAQSGYDGLFSGPADLAISRKMERESGSS